MSCSGHERDLFGPAGGDPPDDAARLRAHLGTCERCRNARARIEEDLQALRALRDEPLAEGSLERVRARLRAAIARDASAPPVGRERAAWVRTRVRRWAIAAAAAAALLASVVAVRWRTSEEANVATHHLPSFPAQSADCAPPQRADAGSAGSDRRARELHRRFASASVAETITVPIDAAAGEAQLERRTHGGPETPQHEAGARRDTASTGSAAFGSRVHARPLTPEDADQLARALVAIADVTGGAAGVVADEAEQQMHAGEDGRDEPDTPADSLETARADGSSRQPRTFLRLATADPKVVIYWQLDSSGGNQ